MKKLSRMLILLLVVVMTLTAVVSCGNDPAPGTTTDPKTSTTNPDKQPDDPTPAKDVIEIGTVAELLDAAKKIAANTDGYATKKFVLTADITLTDAFAPITGFQGEFDGQFHTISGLNLDDAKENAGFFATLEGATVKNLIFKDAKIANSAAECTAGVLAGFAKNSKIDAVTVTGTLTLGGTKAVMGGLLGKAEETTVTNVKAVVTAEGQGEVVGGVIGAMLDKTVLVNAYTELTVADSKATVKGAVVGTKTHNSAVAYALAKSGDLVGVISGDAFLPDYVIASKVGAKASDMGWNTVDWDVSGETPAIKTDLEKKHTAPKVTVDGKEVKTVYGEKLPTALTLPQDENNVAVLGYKLGADYFYADLPLLNDAAIEQGKVDYSDLVGSFKPANASDAKLDVAQTVIFGDKTLTRVWIGVEKTGDYTGVKLYLVDKDGAKYELAFATVDGATYLALTAVSDQQVTYFLPNTDAMAGAWEKDGKILIFDGTYTVKNGKNYCRMLDQSTGTYTDVVPSFVLTSDGVYANVGGYTLKVSDQKVPTVVKGDDTYEVAKSYYNGVWFNEKNESITVVDGKVGDQVLTVEMTAYGTALTYTNADGKKVLLVAGFTGVNVYVDDTHEVYANNNFAGVYVGIVNGVRTELRIDGLHVYVNGAETPVTATVSFKNGVSVLTVTIGNVTYNLQKDGTKLTDTDTKVVFTAPEILEQFTGTFVLGSKKFVIDGAMLNIGADNYALTLTYDGSRYAMVCGEMTLAFDESGDLTVTGYKSSVTGDAVTRKLFKPATATVYMGGFLNEYVSNPNKPDNSIRIAFVGGVMYVDGVETEYELYQNKDGSLGLKFFCVDEAEYDASKKEKVVSVTRNDLGIHVSNVSWGDMIAARLEDVVGSYTEFLYGDTAEDAPAPKGIRFTENGVLIVDGTVVVDELGAMKVTGGTQYTAADYSITTSGATTIVELRKEGGTEYLIFVNKTVMYDDVTYTNFDRMLPATTGVLSDKEATIYTEVGAKDAFTLKVLEGSLGYMEYEYDDDGEVEDETWVPAVYPLYGFELTVDGVTYTSKTFNWRRLTGGTAQIRVNAVSKDGATKSFRITYNTDSEMTDVTLTVDGTDTVVYSTALLEDAFAGTYTNGVDKVEFAKDGAVRINGVRVDATVALDFVKNVYTFTAEDLTFTVDGNRREIAKCGDAVLYDARLFAYAGVKLVAYTTGSTSDTAGTFPPQFQTKYALQLTSEGLKFNGALVDWNKGNASYNSFRFSVPMQIDGETQDVVWSGQNGYNGIQDFGIYMYPNATLDAAMNETGWAYRWFLPELLLDNAGEHAAILDNGKLSIAGIIAPKTADLPAFTFTYGSTTVDYDEYSFYMDGETLVVVLNVKGNSHLLKIKPAADDAQITLDGVLLAPYTRPDMDAFLTEAQKLFMQNNSHDIISIQKTADGYKWIYDPNGPSYMREESENFSFGKWGDLDLLFMEKRNGTTFVAFVLDGKCFVVYADMFELALNAPQDPQGREVKFRFANTDGELNLTATVDGKNATKVTAGTLNYNNDNSCIYLQYTFGGESYAVVRNIDSATAEEHFALTIPFAEFTRCANTGSYRTLTLSGAKLRFIPVYDTATGRGVVKAVLYNAGGYEIQSLEPVAGYTNLYRLVYSDGKETYTDYFVTFPEANNYNAYLYTLTADMFQLLGEHTVAGENVILTIGLGLDSRDSHEVVFYMEINGRKYRMTKTYNKSQVVRELGDDTYIFDVTDGVFGAVKVDTKAYRFTTESSYPLIGGGYYDKAKVTLVNGKPVIVWYNSRTWSYDGDTVEGTFAADYSYIAFTYKDQAYRVYYIPSDSSYHGAMIEETKAAFLGKFLAGTETDRHDLVVEIKTGYTPSLSITFDGKAVSNVQYLSGTAMSFEVGTKVHVLEIVDGEGVITMNVIDLASAENKDLNALKGNYSAVKVVVNYAVTKVDGVWTGKFFVTLDGKDATLAVDTAKNTIDITCGDVVKHFVKVDATTLYELKDSEYAQLGTYQIGGHTLSVVPTIKSKTERVWDDDEEEYVRVTVYYMEISYQVDGNSATATSKTMVDGTKFTQLKTSAASFYFYVDGETMLLQEMSAEEAAILNMSSKTITVDGKTYTLKGVAKFASNVFSAVYTFGSTTENTKEVTLTALPAEAGTGYSFSYEGATYYYLTSGSYTYLITAADYAIYGELTVGGKTLKFTWGNKQVMIAVMGEDGTYGTAVEAVKLSDGTHEYYKFVDNKITYILAKNKDGAWVLTDASNIGANLNHFANFEYQKSKVVTLDGKTVYANFSTGYVILDDGTPVYALIFGDLVITAYTELNGEVIQVTIDGVERYFVVAPNYARGSSWYFENYTMVEVTAAQAAFFGKTATVEGVCFTVLAKGSSYGSPEISIYVYEEGTEPKNWGTSPAKATFSADGTTLSFSHNGTSYTATIVDGALVVTAA